MTRVRMKVTIESVEPVAALVAGGYARSTRVASTMHVMRDELGRKVIWYATGDKRLLAGGSVTAEVVADMTRCVLGLTFLTSTYGSLLQSACRRCSHRRSNHDGRRCGATRGGLACQCGGYEGR